MLSREEYRSRDAIGLAELVRSGEVTAREVLDAAIAEIERLDPALNAVCEDYLPFIGTGRCGRIGPGSCAGAVGLIRPMNPMTEHVETDAYKTGDLRPCCAPRVFGNLRPR